jgi:transposase
MREPAVGQHETRDALITELSRLGRSDGQIAAIFGVGRSRIQQIASSRRS